MGVDSNIQGNSVAGHVIEHDGRTYQISLIDQRVKAEFEKTLFRRAMQAAEILAESKPAGWLEDKLSQMNDEFMAGGFALISEVGQKVLRNPGGVHILLSILTGLDTAELIPLISAKAAQVKALLHLVIRESFPGVNLQPTDPNG